MTSLSFSGPSVGLTTGGFIRITGGPNAGQRGLALRAIFSDKMLIVTDAGDTLYEDIVAGQDFDFEYVEG